jgi:hypothetical protein
VCSLESAIAIKASLGASDHAAESHTPKRRIAPELDFEEDEEEEDIEKEEMAEDGFDDACPALSAGTTQSSFAASITSNLRSARPPRGPIDRARKETGAE